MLTTAAAIQDVMMGRKNRRISDLIRILLKVRNTAWYRARAWAHAKSQFALELVAGRTGAELDSHGGHCALMHPLKHGLHFVCAPG